MDPKANGQVQQQWGWLLAAYLFLGGVGAGAYVIAALHGIYLGKITLATTVGLWISWPAVALGSVCLLADLGAPVKAILAGIKLGTSWIARGFWIISIFMILAFTHTMLVTYAEPDPALIQLISVLGIVFAIGTMAYTGILLGAAKAIQIWRSGVVPVLFVISALATGHFTVMLGMAAMSEGAATASELTVMGFEAAVLVLFEIMAILFFLQAAYRHPDAKESAQRLLAHQLFVVFYIVGGLLVPLLANAVLFWGTAGATEENVLTLSTLGAALGLFGGLVLRQSVLVTGTLPTWNIAGFKFRRIARPKEPKAEIGMLPPS